MGNTPVTQASDSQSQMEENDFIFDEADDF